MSDVPHPTIARRVRRASALAAALLAFAALPASIALPSPAFAAPQAAAPAPASASAAPLASGPVILGLAEDHLDPAFWIARTRNADRVVMDHDAIAGQNMRLHDDDPSMHDLSALPTLIERGMVEALLGRVSVPPTATLYDETGKAGTPRQIARVVANADLERVPESQVARFGLVVQRADLRRFPTRLRVFSTAGDTDIDRFQESAAFVGTPVAILHESKDRAWLFVVTPDYAAWIEKIHVAVGERDQVLGYARRSATLLVTGAWVETAFNPVNRGLSKLQLDMGVRLPLRSDWPPGQPVDGQLPLASHVVDLPVRAKDGSLSLAPALVPRGELVTTDVPAFTRATLLRHAFRFLGERYGWGHDYGGRDCSGFVREVYASLGIAMPRNTGDQARSPAFDRIDLAAADADDRRRALREALTGDLLYMPGHVMMVVGHVDGAPWVIHDTAGATLRGPDGTLARLPLNGVVVTPLAPLLTDDGTPWSERLTTVVRMRPAGDAAPAPRRRR